MIWTVTLVSVGVTGMLCAARHWWGWLINLSSELLWFSYATVTGDRPLQVMACVWALANARNVLVTWRLRELKAHT